MDNRHLRLVDEEKDSGAPEAEIRLENPDLTPKMMAYSALATIAIFLIYGLIRSKGAAAPTALLTVTYAAGAGAAATFVLALLRSDSWTRLLVMLATVSVFTGSCFAVSHSAQDFSFTLLGAGALFAGFLLALLRNVDERVKFMPMVISMLVSSTIILFSLGC